MGTAAGSPWLRFLPGPVQLTWDVLGPADDDHELSVCQVTESGQGLDVTLRHAGGRHGVQLVRFSHQQVGDNLGHCKDQIGKVKAWKEGGAGAEAGWVRKQSQVQRNPGRSNLAVIFPPW